MKISNKLRTRIKQRIIESIRNPDEREVIVRTPYALTDEDLSSMKSSLPGLASAQIMNEVDRSLIGGMVIIDGSMILDYSVKGKISNIVNSILEN